LLNWKILHGDVREQLASLPNGCVQTCVTSPPYFGLRDYGHAGQIGLEPTPKAFVAALVAVFREVRRVLADDGTLWLNLGDSYAGYWGDKTAKREGRASSADTNGWTNGFNMNNRPSFHTAFDGSGIKPKDLIGIPWRVAFALQADGWYLRSDIIWSKPNPMPESVTDRPTKAHEYIFLLSKSARYFYDNTAICEAGVVPEGTRRTIGKTKAGGDNRAEAMGRTASGNEAIGFVNVSGQRNKRSVWHVATQPYSGAHFATFPEALIEPCILAGSRVGDTVLDPFTGSGTTGAVAIRHQRNFIGCELNADYIALAERRIGAVSPLFSSGEVQGATTLTAATDNGQQQSIF
jgi:DNA modification methylase